MNDFRSQCGVWTGLLVAATAVLAGCAGGGAAVQVPYACRNPA